MLGIMKCLNTHNRTSELVPSADEVQVDRDPYGSEKMKLGPSYTQSREFQVGPYLTSFGLWLMDLSISLSALSTWCITIAALENHYLI